MFILKKYGKQGCYDQSVGCKYIPTGVPPGYDLLSGGRFRQSVHKTIDDGRLVQGFGLGDNVPMVAPKPLVIIMNNPCALLRMLMSVSLSTNKEPETLKKSKATP